MKLLGCVVVLGLLVAGAWAQVLRPSIVRPPCDSPEVEAAALVAQDYINAQHTHGYKWALNQIDDIKIRTTPGGAETYDMEVELLETKCHVLDPTHVAACPVRPKAETAVEADCDVVLSKAGGIMSVVAFKCKTDLESAEDLCVGCPRLVPLNHTEALQLASSSLAVFNNQTKNGTFALLEVGRLASQDVFGGPKLFAEYAIIETNCTGMDDDICVPLNYGIARHGFCVAEGGNAIKVDCRIFAPPTATVDPVTNATVPAPPPVVLHAHTAHTAHFSPINGLRHHKLTAVHDPAASGLLSESDESDEIAPVVVPAAAVVVPVAAVEPVAVPIVKREAPVPEAAAPELPAIQAVPLLPICPGKVKHF